METMSSQAQITTLAGPLATLVDRNPLRQEPAYVCDQLCFGCFAAVIGLSSKVPQTKLGENCG